MIQVPNALFIKIISSLHELHDRLETMRLVVELDREDDAALQRARKTCAEVMALGASRPYAEARK